MFLTRRTFLSTVFVFVIGSTSALLASCRSDDRGRVEAENQLVQRYGDPEVLRALGREAVVKLPEGSQAQQLRDRIAAERGMEALQDEIQDQYARGETLDLRGWPVAMTEARIYALLAAQ